MKGTEGNDEMDLGRIASILASGVDRIDGKVRVLGPNGYETLKYRAYRVLNILRIDLYKKDGEEVNGQ